MRMPNWLTLISFSAVHFSPRSSTARCSGCSRSSDRCRCRGTACRGWSRTQLRLETELVVGRHRPAGAVRAEPRVRNEAVVADRLQPVVVEEAAEALRVRQVGRTSGCIVIAGIAGRAARVVGVLAVARELDCVKPTLLRYSRVPSIRRVAARADRDRWDRPEVRTAEIPHGGRDAGGRARRDPEPAWHVSLRERDRPDLRRQGSAGHSRQPSRPAASGPRPATIAVPAPMLSTWRRLSFRSRTMPFPPPPSQKRPEDA